MSGWTWGWAVWAAVLAGTFAALEWRALRARRDVDGDGRTDRTGTTLSEQVWWLRRRHPIAVRVAVGGFLAWLAWHLTVGGPS